MKKKLQKAFNVAGDDPEKMDKAFRLQEEVDEL